MPLGVKWYSSIDMSLQGLELLLFWVKSLRFDHNYQSSIRKGFNSCKIDFVSLIKKLSKYTLKVISCCKQSPATATKSRQSAE